jgi:hypothetical protein
MSLVLSFEKVKQISWIVEENISNIEIAFDKNMLEQFSYFNCMGCTVTYNEYKI